MHTMPVSSMPKTLPGWIRGMFLALGLLVLLTGCGASNKVNAFDTARWTAEKGNFDKPSAREALLEDAIRHLPTGLPRDEVLQRFGEPDASDADGFLYHLGRVSFGVHTESWLIEFDAQGRVRSQKVRRT
jgi:hypothetical protein